VLSPRGAEPQLALFAQALAELFGTSAELHPEGFRPPPGLEPLILHLGTDADAERKLVELMGEAEGFALAQRLR